VRVTFLERLQPPRTPDGRHHVGSLPIEATKGGKNHRSRRIRAVSVVERWSEKAHASRCLALLLEEDAGMV
jgi:hypothetical protein